MSRARSYSIAETRVEGVTGFTKSFHVLLWRRLIRMMSHVWSDRHHRHHHFKTV
jgi:hypothetical protein